MATRGELLDETPEVALAVFAHPDCPMVNCGGTMAVWAAAGTAVHLVVMTRGEKGGLDPDPTEEEVAARRAERLERSRTVLGLASLEILDFPDGELENDLDLRRAIVTRVRRHRPDVVLFHDPTAVIYGDRYVSHPDHRAVGWAALDAIGAPSWSPRYHRDLGEPHTIGDALLCGSLEPDTFVDVGGALEAKAMALREHVDEADDADWIDHAVRTRASEAGDLAGIAAAEGFRRLTLAM